MGSRDYRHRETKKPKKGIEKPVKSIINTAPTTVEVIKAKGKKEKPEEAE